MVRIHVIQHVPFEGPALFAELAEAKGYALEITHIYKGGPLPALDSFDWLVVLGGPMGVYDEELYPWLQPEHKLVASAIAADKVVVGVCLGAQLIASSLGAKVVANRFKEIGWFPVELTAEAVEVGIFGGSDKEFTPFHWHGDTFALPQGAQLLASSTACLNQAFVYKERVVGLQFHIETTEVGLNDIIAGCENELVPGEYVQDKFMLQEGLLSYQDDIKQKLYALFSYLESLT